MIDIPKDKNHPADAVQCNGCGGNGCAMCGDKGWLFAGDSNGRVCLKCKKPIPPAHVAVYCSNECALQDCTGVMDWPLVEGSREAWREWANPDTSDIPETDEEWFKKARMVRPDDKS